MESHCGKGMVFAVNPGSEGSNNSFSNFLAIALEIGANLAANATNTTNVTTTVSGSGSKPSSTGIGGSGKSGHSGAISVNGANAMLMTGLGMAVGLMV